MGCCYPCLFSNLRRKKSNNRPNSVETCALHVRPHPFSLPPLSFPTSLCLSTYFFLCFYPKFFCFFPLLPQLSPSRILTQSSSLPPGSSSLMLHISPQLSHSSSRFQPLVLLLLLFLHCTVQLVGPFH